ncbi:L,D-transpeptidase family protein [Lachnospiraceae bacterium 47-T17]
MGKNRSRKRSAALLALMLALSMLFSIAGNLTVAKAAEKYYIKINKGTNVVTVYESDGTPYVAFTCSAGYATPIGTFHTMAKYRWWELDGPSYGQYCTRITGSILFHSVWYYQNRTPNSQSYVQYNKLGTTASHGCCRLTVAASKWIYENCPTGTKVIIFNGSSKDDPLGKPKTIKVSGYSGWDPTDPDPSNPYKTKSTKPVITVSKKTLALGDKFGDGYMTCKDSGGFEITDWVKMTGKVNMAKAGSYPVTYWVIDSFGRTATKKVTYKVVDKSSATLTGVKENLTKEYGSTRDMLVGLKAKNYAGTDLTDKIEVYVKAPGSKSYVKCKSTEYTFEKVGTYQVKYIVVNPGNGKKTTKKQKIVVKDTKAPVFTSADDWQDVSLSIAPGAEELYWDDLMDGISAVLRSGTDLTDEVKIKITSPSGTSVTIVEGQTYTFEESGTYKFVYTVKNPTKNAKGSYASGKAACNYIVELTPETPETPEPESEVALDE